jgi:hypothetical protein
MIENNTKGMAISFKRLIKMVPNGAIQSMVNFDQPIVELKRAHRIPRMRPMMI